MLLEALLSLKSALVEALTHKHHASVAGALLNIKYGGDAFWVLSFRVRIVLKTIMLQSSFKYKDPRRPLLYA